MGLRQKGVSEDCAGEVGAQSEPCVLVLISALELVLGAAGCSGGVCELLDGVQDGVSLLLGFYWEKLLVGG